MIGPFERKDIRSFTERNFAFKMTCRFVDLPDVSRWCQDRWGLPARVISRNHPDGPGFYLVADRTWARAYADFFFKEADQAFEFKMRWG